MPQHSTRINYRRRPDAYVIGKGEQGVFRVEPYKSELLPYWRFKTPEVAMESAEALYRCFRHYLEQDDFVGADMARKYLQMGYTRARRYARHPGGRKAAHKSLTSQQENQQKARSARIFFERLQWARWDPHYQRLKMQHQQRRHPGAPSEAPDAAFS